jgi:Ca2+-binding EF-hand superfamily protein
VLRLAHDESISGSDMREILCVQTTAKDTGDRVKEMFDAFDTDHNGEIS